MAKRTRMCSGARANCFAEFVAVLAMGLVRELLWPSHSAIVTDYDRECVSTMATELNYRRQPKQRLMSEFVDGGMTLFPRFTTEPRMSIGSFSVAGDIAG